MTNYKKLHYIVFLSIFAFVTIIVPVSAKEISSIMSFNDELHQIFKTEKAELQVEIQVVNESSLQISKVNKILVDFEFNTPDNLLRSKGNIVLKDKNTLLEESNREGLILNVSTDNTDTILEWSVNSIDDVPIVSKAIIRVDYDAFDKDNKQKLTEKDIVRNTIIEAIEDSYRSYLKAMNTKLLSDTERNENIFKSNRENIVLFGSTDYDWKLVQTGQNILYYAPYGQVRNTTTIKKAHFSNGPNDHFLSSQVIAQVNPGAQLCSSSSNYECKYQVDKNIDFEIFSDGSTAVMVEHQPTNIGNSGNVGYSVGAGYSWGQGLNATAAFNYSQNWSDLTFNDNSVYDFVGSYIVKGSLQKKVVSVSASAVFYHSDSESSVYPYSFVNAEFDSWNTLPVWGQVGGISPKVQW